MRILFVCTGNICRSAFAERYLRRQVLLRQAPPGGHGTVTAESAGTGAVVHAEMDGQAAAQLARRGGDPTGFHARQLTREHVAGADLVLCMTGQHRGAVLALAPAALLKTFTLAEAAHLCRQAPAGGVRGLATARTRASAAAPDIEDPYRRSDRVFSRVCSEIAGHVDTVLGALAPGAAHVG